MSSQIDIFDPPLPIIKRYCESNETSNASHNLLPNEIILKIFSYLGLSDMTACSEASRQWNTCAMDTSLWQQLFHRDFPHLGSSFGTTHYKEVYKKFYLEHENLINGVYTSKTFLGKHNGQVSSLAATNEILYSASEDGLIKGWDVQTGACAKVFAGHHDMVLSIAIADGILCSASKDRTIRIWDLTTGAPLKTFLGQDTVISSLVIDQRILYSGCWAHTIQAWDLKTGACINIFKGHNSGIRSLTMSEGILYSASLDGTIKAWNPNTSACIKTYKIDEEPLFLLVAEGILYVACNNGEIKVCDLKAGTWMNALSGHTNSVHSLSFSEGTLYSGSWDRTIKAWDVRTRACINTFTGRYGVICSVAAVKGILYAGFFGGEIQSWDFSASHDAVFREIVSLLRGIHPVDLEKIMKRFESMPKKAKAEIYSQHYSLLRKSAYTYQSSENLQSSVPVQEQLAQAIESYLISKNNSNYAL